MPPVARLFVYFRRYPRKFVLGIASVIVSRALYLAAPGVLGYAVDELTRGVTVSRLALSGWLLIGLGVAGVPGSSFYKDPSKGRTQLRFCFCKKDSTLTAADERLAKLVPAIAGARPH